VAGHPSIAKGWPKPPIGPWGVDRPPPRAKKNYYLKEMGLALGGGRSTPKSHWGWISHPQGPNTFKYIYILFGPWGWPIHPPRAKGWLRPPQTGGLLLSLDLVLCFLINLICSPCDLSIYP
jgi:hypothetical protein